ncbi:MAG: hypothetical protein D6679_09900 [Candidatus Hydrogenedentota bacterium]|nr:MAG: hypothetical protein D6679_09900 [Candidatus Hydrogenedentota bacterium]
MTLLVVVVALLLLYWTITGFTVASDSPEAIRSEEKALHAIVDAAVNEIRDLDADQDAGKISPEDYRVARERVERRAARALMRLEQLADGNEARKEGRKERREKGKKLKKKRKGKGKERNEKD